LLIERWGQVARQSRVKQVAFFEIRDADGKVFDDLIPWEKHLAEMAHEKAAERRHLISGVPHWGGRCRRRRHNAHQRGGR
jgi:hypothetical protein